MKEIFNLKNLNETSHYSNWRWRHNDPSEAKACVWSNIVDSAHEFSYNYDYLVTFINRLNKYVETHIYVEHYEPLPVPTKLEFLEILEFRETELQRIYGGINPDLEWKERDEKENRKEVIIQGEKYDDRFLAWQWPDDWPHIHWNNVNHKKEHRNFKHSKEIPDWVQGQLCLLNTQRGIENHKILMGHYSPVSLTETELKCISHLYNIFLNSKIFNNIMELPSIIISYDLPGRLKKNITKNDNVAPGKWDIDNLLGEYCPENLWSGSRYKPQIILYERGLKACSETTGLSRLHLRAIVIIHEIAHYLVNLLSDINGNVWKKDLYNLTRTEVHEGWAQLLTYCSISSTSNHTFEELNKHQSSPYHKFKEILNKCKEKIILEHQRQDHYQCREILNKCTDEIFNTLPILRAKDGGASFSDWMSLL